MKKKQQTNMEDVENLVEKILKKYPELASKKDDLLQDK